MGRFRENEANAAARFGASLKASAAKAGHGHGLLTSTRLSLRERQWRFAMMIERCGTCFALGMMLAGFANAAAPPPRETPEVSGGDHLRIELISEHLSLTPGQSQQLGILLRHARVDIARGFQGG
jgi:hypothetical protein